VSQNGQTIASSWSRWRHPVTNYGRRHFIQIYNTTNVSRRHGQASPFVSHRPPQPKRTQHHNQRGETTNLEPPSRIRYWTIWNAHHAYCLLYPCAGGGESLATVVPPMGHRPRTTSCCSNMGTTDLYTYTQGRRSTWRNQTHRLV
jgi:hypothetical protein